ncbi:MAG TPA: co-chaperone GroES [Armatimonadota bacterium]|nr:co-chaperone GroES [Armatimonadota bacterium]
MLKPLGGRVLIKPLDSEAKSSGGIILPDSAQTKPSEGTIIAVGDGKLLDSGEIQAMSVAVGDLVIYSEYAGTEIKVAGDDLLLVDCDAVLAVREPDAKPKKKAKKKK